MKVIITVALVVLVSISVQVVGALPWWSFVIPVFFVGVLLPLQKWKVTSFLWGFISGVIVWISSTIYFEKNAQGDILKEVAGVFDVHEYLLYLGIGAIGGVLTGLALYSGYLLRKGRDRLELDLP